MIRHSGLHFGGIPVVHTHPRRSNISNHRLHLTSPLRPKL